MFMQTFLAEVHAIVRSQVAAMSGDGIMSFAINDVTLLDSSHKNQVRCFVSPHLISDDGSMKMYSVLFSSS